MTTTSCLTPNVTDAYSGTCLAPPQVFNRPEVATPTVAGPTELPVTGAELVFLLLLGVLLVGIGLVVTRLGWFKAPETVEIETTDLP